MPFLKLAGKFPHAENCFEQFWVFCMECGLNSHTDSVRIFKSNVFSMGNGPMAKSWPWDAHFFNQLREPRLMAYKHSASGELRVLLCSWKKRRKINHASYIKLHKKVIKFSSSKNCSWISVTDTWQHFHLDVYMIVQCLYMYTYTYM